MTNIDAFFMTIKTLFSIFIFYQFFRVFAVFPQICIVLSQVEREIELNFLDNITLPWFLANNTDILNNAMNAFNNKELVAAQIFTIIDDDDDDEGDFAIYKEDLAKV
jgi:hypothetical protein